MRALIARFLFFALLAANAFAIMIGLVFYQEQLEATPQNLWFFVPDCPLFVFLGLLVMLKFVKNDFFSFFASCGMVKYGLWTISVMLFHFRHYLLSDVFSVSVIFIIGHIIMVLEGLAILPKRKVGQAAFLMAIALLLLNDFFDYVVGTVPTIPQEGLPVVAIATAIASVLIPLALWQNHEKLRAHSPVRLIRRLIGN